MNTALTVGAAVTGAILLVWIGWLIFGARAADTPSTIPANLRPYLSDEELEGRHLNRTLMFSLGVGLVVSISLGFSIMHERSSQVAEAGEQEEQAVERGELEIWTGGANCSGCHGLDGGGGVAAWTEPRTGLTVSWQAPSLNDVYYRYDPDEVEYWITYGRQGTPMPAWGLAGGGALTEQQIQDVMTYLETIQLDQGQVVTNAASDAEEALRNIKFAQQNWATQARALELSVPGWEAQLEWTNAAYEAINDVLDPIIEEMAEPGARPTDDMREAIVPVLEEVELEAAAAAAESAFVQAQATLDATTAQLAADEGFQLLIEAVDALTPDEFELPEDYETAAAILDESGHADVAAFFRDPANATIVEVIGSAVLEDEAILNAVGGLSADDLFLLKAPIASLQQGVLGLPALAEAVAQPEIPEETRTQLDAIEEAQQAIDFAKAERDRFRTEFFAAQAQLGDLEDPEIGPGQIQLRLENLERATAEFDQEATEGAALFNANCARCHTAGFSAAATLEFALAPGSGAFGPALRDGRSLVQFPDDCDTPETDEGIEAQVDFVENGSQNGQSYGANGIGRGWMPGFGTSLTAEQIRLIVDYERSFGAPEGGACAPEPQGTEDTGVENVGSPTETTEG